MKNQNLLNTLLIFVLIVTFFSCQKKNESPAPDPNQPLIDQLNVWGDSLTRNIIIDSVNYSAPGAMIYVNDPAKGISFINVFGTSDISVPRFLPLKSGDLFRIGTVTATFTATVFLQLVQDGAISLGDKLSSYFPDIPNAENITLLQVANMTSGLYDFEETDTMRTIWQQHPLSVLTPGQLVNIGIAQPPYFQPGEGCRYSNTNSVLMGMIIEKVTSDALQDAYRKRILEPLGLSSTTFPENEFMPFYASCSHGYEYPDSTHTPYDVTERYDPSWSWGSGNLISRLSEMQIWLPALVEGTLLTQSIQQQRLTMVNWETIHGIPMQCGLGIMGTSGYYGYTGDNKGYRCIIMENPSTKQIIMVMVNNGTASPLLMFAQIANLLNPGLIPLQL